MECPKCRTRAWSARCPECDFQLLPDSPSGAGGASFELDVRAPPTRAAQPPMAVTGVAPRAPRARPPAGSVPPLTLERRWSRGPAWGWGLIGGALVIAAARTAAGHLPMRVAVGLLGLGLLYVALCFALNTTTLRIQAGRLAVVRGPIPAGGNRDIRLDDIAQVFVRRTHHSRRKYPWMRYWSPREHYLRYHVLADLAGSGEVELVGDFEEVQDALRYERTLESHIGITDDPMRSL